MTALYYVLAGIILVLLIVSAALDFHRLKWRNLYQHMISKMAVGTQQLTEARQQIMTATTEWGQDKIALMKFILAIGELSTELKRTFPEDKSAIDLHGPCVYASGVIRFQKQTLDKREATDRELNKFCDLKSLEMLVRRAETMPQINMPKGVKVFTDEIGTVLFSPGAIGMPKRYFAYLYRGRLKPQDCSKQFHVTEKPDFFGTSFAKVTFVQDEWLTHGEVIGKLAAAAKSLASEQPR